MTQPAVVMDPNQIYETGISEFNKIEALGSAQKLFPAATLEDDPNNPGQFMILKNDSAGSGTAQNFPLPFGGFLTVADLGGGRFASSTSRPGQPEKKIEQITLIGTDTRTVDIGNGYKAVYFVETKTVGGVQQQGVIRVDILPPQDTEPSTFTPRDAIKVAGGNLVETSKDKFTFVPGVVQLDDPRRIEIEGEFFLRFGKEIVPFPTGAQIKTLTTPDGRQIVGIEQPNGSFAELGALAEFQVIEKGGQKFIQIRQPDGKLFVQQLDAPPGEASADVRSIDGREFIQVVGTDGNISLKELEPKPQQQRVHQAGGRTFTTDAQGNITQLSQLTMEQIITQSILAGDWEGAVTLDDFRNRPTSAQAFQAALDFAKSPADSAVISALARGESGIVEQDFQLGAAIQGLGGVRRIGPQPEFLQTAFERLQESIEAGRPETLQDLVANFQVGQQGTAAAPIGNVLPFGAKNTSKSINPFATNPVDGIGAAAATTKSLDDALNFIRETLFPNDPAGYQNFLAEAKVEADTSGISLSAESVTKRASALEAVRVEQDKVLADEGKRKEEARAEEVIRAEEEKQKALAQEVYDRAIIAAVQSGMTGSQAKDFVELGIKPGDPRPAPTAATSADFIDSLDDPGTGFGGLSAADIVGDFEPLSAAQSVAAATRLGDVQTTAEAEAAQYGVDSSQPGFGGFDDDDFLAHGGTFDDNTAIVGEKGPELMIAPVGTKVFPLDDLDEEQIKELKEKGVKAFAHGGTVHNQGDLSIDPNAFPLGIQQLLGGATIQSARSIFPVAGLTVPSAQAQRRLLPSEFEFLRGQAEFAGIPFELFDRELAATRPGRSGRQARFQAAVAN